MAVGILSEETKERIFNSFFEDGESKCRLAQTYGVSERTIGRVIKELEEKDYEPSDVMDEEDDVFEDFAEDSQSVDYEYTVVATKDSIQITCQELIDGEVQSYSTENVAKGDKDFEAVSSIVWGGQGSQESLEEAFNIMSTEELMKSFSNGRVSLDIENVALYVDDIKLPSTLFDKFITLQSEGKTADLDKYARFAEHLSDNVSNQILTRLYDFISHNSIKITEDGMIVCYKKVASDYKDIYTRTFDNTPGGPPVQVKRNQVDENMDRTCSHGLHVCAAHYLPSYGASGSNRVVKCLLNPEDVVAIPRDYKDSKVRCCKYVVIEDVTDQYNEGKLHE